MGGIAKAPLFLGPFMPHGMCYLWDPPLIALHAIADSLIALAYFSIPVLLAVLVRRRSDLPFHWMFWMFGAFIFACGTTHALETYTIWVPAYWLSGAVKALTAGVSLATAVALVPTVPKALALPRYAAELKRRNEDLERFAYVASHDLKEPLRMVTSYVQLLERRYRGRLDADADEFIGFAVDGATRMQQLIDDLLAYARLDAELPRLTKVPLGEVLRTVAQNLHGMIEDSGARISHGNLPVVAGDPILLTELLQNLLANGIKFRGPSAPEIRITTELDGRWWTVSVLDNGIGIDPAQAERIFAPFQRLHSHSEIPGTGIGLAICRRIVESHGGRIWVESTPGEGSCFRFTLPAVTSAGTDRKPP